jgi:hypothetical protein
MLGRSRQLMKYPGSIKSTVRFPIGQCYKPNWRVHQSSIYQANIDFCRIPSTIARISIGCQTADHGVQKREGNQMKVSLAFFRCFREYDRLKGKESS